ncbi:cell wall hydrolase [Pontixanthobacter aestiaquae]|uniref:Cell wall hydrolase n=2 Tax=Pontixanthobacter aestiaquae TaxID=1509367 RepID=A0A844ZDR8_9SPHN|nr:cell wall hydrolase [Pontixanthobacter aestiaquae]MDN3645071.1 cell wall hydrolase [Pontixanthobacter aestiaquae]MXO83929.1 cell wall hydrolase [Pontixanthobacter aestiaquae]
MSKKRPSVGERAKVFAAGLIGGKHRGRRIIALAAAITVPAMAAEGEWASFGPQKPETALIQAVEAMPFEQPGQSFPGSAFYFLEDAPRADYAAAETDMALFDISGTGDTDAAELVAANNAGPAARAFRSLGGGLDKARALQCMTKAIYYEAASEATAGQRAVAQVVLNRVSHPSYPNSVCGVVFQGSERKTGCQFSFTCDGSLNRKASSGAWARAQSVAQQALSGSVYRPVGLATHYHTIWIHPYWAPSLDHIGTIGAHRFYKWKGSAGKPAAFRAAYSGREPLASPKARAASADTTATDIADPIALAKAYEDARLKAVAESKTATPRAPAPKYSAQIEERGGDQIFQADNLPESGGVKEEYRNSGRWINEPK